MTLYLIWGVWLILNLITFVLYGMDKRRAKRGVWRIQEKTLLTATWLMGGVGACLAMHLFRHKTKHRRFCLAAPLAAVVSLAVMTIATVWIVTAI